MVCGKNCNLFNPVRNIMQRIESTRQIALGLLFSFAILLPGWSAMPQATPVVCENNLGSSIPNFCQVTPDILWRGAKPDKAGAAWLIEQGVRTIVNLEMLHDDQETIEQTRLKNNGKYKVSYYRIRDWEPLPIIASNLSDEHVAQFLAIMEQAPKPVYVHCRSGENRTGLMVAAYRVIVEGESDEKAIDEMERYNGFWSKTDARYIRNLTPQRREVIRRNVKQWIPKLNEEVRFVCEQGECRSYK